MAVSNHTLYYQQDLRVPMTSLSFVFHGGGEQQEQEEMAGLARLTSKLLLRGTQHHTREALQTKLELLGAELQASVSETDFVFRISCFTRTIDEVLLLVEEILNEAAFLEEELALVKKQELNKLDAMLQDTESVVRTAHRYVLYNGTRFGKFGSKKSIQKISRHDCANYFEKVHACSILYFTAISDLSKDEIEKKLILFTNKRKTHGFVLQPEIPFRASHGKEAFIFHSEKATNDRLFWSHAGISAADERRFALNLILDALGSFEGYLFDELRNKKGWCYGVYAFSLQGTTRPGRVGYYSDPSDTTSVHLIPELLRSIQTFAKEESFLARLTERNMSFKNRYAYQLDKNYILMSEVYRDRYGIPILTREEYYAKIDAVTAEYAHEVIADIFDAHNITMVFYGDENRLKNILREIDSTMPIVLHKKEVLVE